jgi:hypothetical protein
MDVPAHANASNQFRERYLRSPARSAQRCARWQFLDWGDEIVSEMVSATAARLRALQEFRRKGVQEFLFLKIKKLLISLTPGLLSRLLAVNVL